MSDITCTISELHTYPIKSCCGQVSNEALLIETGFELDRAWMVVDEAGRFVTQRDFPRMALISTVAKTDDLIVSAPGMQKLYVPIGEAGPAASVIVWEDTVSAFDMGDLAAQWFSDFINEDPERTHAKVRLRLVRFDPAFERKSDPQWAGLNSFAVSQFSDGYASLIASQASLELLNSRLKTQGHSAVTMSRFRPNIVLSGIEAHEEDLIDTLTIETDDGDVVLRLCKPCARCPIPNIDPATAISHPAVSDALQQYRQNAALDGAITFGMNAYVVRADNQPVNYSLRVGQKVRATLKF